MASRGGFDSIPWLTSTRQAPVVAPASHRDPFAAANAARDAAKASCGFDEDEESNATTKAWRPQKKNYPSKTMILRVARVPDKSLAPAPVSSRPQLFEMENPPAPLSDPFAVAPASKPLPTRPIWILTGVLLAIFL
ncbi:MAG TPA: hypothetical protein VIF62_03015, partial [Labilithrix sp.]